MQTQPFEADAGAYARWLAHPALMNAAHKVSASAARTATHRRDAEALRVRLATIQKEIATLTTMRRKDRGEPSNRAAAGAPRKSQR